MPSCQLTGYYGCLQVNFTIRHFHHLFVFSSAYSCTVRDAFQAMERVRNRRSPELYLCLEEVRDMHKQGLSTSLREARQKVQNLE